MEFKDRLKELRKSKKLTQKDLASILCYGYTAISNYESGRNEPSIADLKKIAIFFNVSMDYLLCVTDIDNTENNEDNYFHNIYNGLSDINKYTVKQFSGWLYDQQNTNLYTSSNNNRGLKVAEEKAPYIAKK